MNLTRLQGLFSSAQRIGERNRNRRGKSGAFEQELAGQEGSGEEKVEEENREISLTRKEHGSRLLVKKTTPKQSSHDKGLKVDLIA